MTTYMQNYLHRRLLRLAGQPDTATDYYSDYVARGNGVNCIVYDSLDFTDTFNRASIEDHYQRLSALMRQWRLRPT